MEETKTATQMETMPAKANGSVINVAAEVMPQEVAIFEMQQRSARLFAQSGLFTDIKSTDPATAIAQSFVKIALGHAMGFSPAESMQGIDLIQGRPAIGAHLRAARMKMAGYSWPEMLLTDKGCWMPLRYQGKPMMRIKVDAEGKVMYDQATGEPLMEQVVVSFTEAHAKVMGLIGKDNWKKNAEDMYFARCVTRAQRRYASEVLGSTGSRVLDTTETPEEFSDAPIATDFLMPKRLSETVTEEARPVAPTNTNDAALFELGMAPAGDPDDSKKRR